MLYDDGLCGDFKIAMGLCSGVLGMCRSRYCSQGIEILFLAPFCRNARAGMHEPVDWCLWSMEMQLGIHRVVPVGMRGLQSVRFYSARLVLYTPAVSSRNCCEIAAGLWIALGLVRFCAAFTGIGIGNWSGIAGPELA